MWVEVVRCPTERGCGLGRGQDTGKREFGLRHLGETVASCGLVTVYDSWNVVCLLRDGVHLTSGLIQSGLQGGTNK